MNMDSKSEFIKLETAYNCLQLLHSNDKVELRSHDNALQSVINLNQPHQLALKNLETMVAALLFVAAPTRILLLGTAAGSLIHFLSHHYAAEITAVDIDAELIEKMLVLKILPTATSQLNYVYDDAQHFIQHCSQKFDLILVDVFDGAQSPRWLLQHETLATLYRLLEPNAAIAFNLLINSDRDFTHFYRNLRQVCEQQTLCAPVDDFENTIAFGFRELSPPRDLQWYQQRSLELSEQHAIDYLKILSTICTTNPVGQGVIR